METSLYSNYESDQSRNSTVNERIRLKQNWISVESMEAKIFHNVISSTNVFHVEMKLLVKPKLVLRSSRRKQGVN